MRESPKHTYFIIRAAMTCFFLVVPLFVLRAPLEWMGRMLAADGRITEWIWNQAYPQYMTRANPGGWIRSLFAGEGEDVYKRQSMIRRRQTRCSLSRF